MSELVGLGWAKAGCGRVGGALAGARQGEAVRSQRESNTRASSKEACSWKACEKCSHGLLVSRPRVAL
eukprot:10813300-Alexandrium_andersonii.AAC.1